MATSRYVDAVSQRKPDLLFGLEEREFEPDLKRLHQFRFAAPLLSLLGYKHIVLMDDYK